MSRHLLEKQRRDHRRWILPTACLLLATVQAGCRRSDGRLTVSGIVTLDGERMDGGEVVFVPIEPDMPTEAGYIRAGRYTAHVAPGTKQVVIRWERPHPTKTIAGAEPGTVEPLPVQVVPAQYNDRTQLTVAITNSTSALNFELEGAIPFD